MMLPTRSLLLGLLVLGLQCSCASFPTTLAGFFERPPLYEKLETPAENFARAFHRMSALDESVILFGGMSGDSPHLPPVISAAWSLNVSARTWNPLPLAHQPAARFAHAQATSGKLLFIWGGQGAEGVLYDDGALWDPAAGHWQTLPAAPIKGRRYAVAIWSGKEFLVVGGSAESADLAMIVAYSPSTKTWRKVTKLPVPGRVGHSVNVVDQQLYIWGGKGPSEFYNEGWRYDLATGQWHPLPSSPLSPRTNHSAVVIGEQIVIWGGAAGMNKFTDGAVFNLETLSWSDPFNLALTPRSGFQAIALQNSLFIWGGRSDDLQYLNDGMLYDPDSGQASYLQLSEFEGRMYHDMVPLGGRALIAGGFGKLPGGGLTYYGDGFIIEPHHCEAAEQQPCRMTDND